MRTREIGTARDDFLVHIFEDLSDAIVVEPKAQYNALVGKIVRMLVLYLQKLQELTYFHEYHPEKKLKKASFEEFNKELDKLKSVEEGVARLMFKR